MRKAMMLGASVAALAVWSGAAQADNITYTGSRNAGDIAATYSFTTDGVIGTVLASDVVDYSIDLINGQGSFVLTPSNSSIQINPGINAFTSTPTNLTFPSDGFYTAFVSSALETDGNPEEALVFYEGDGGDEYELKIGSEAVVESSIFYANSIASVASPEVSSAPEPGSWALIMMGVGALGLMLRRRRSFGTLTAA